MAGMNAETESNGAGARRDVSAAPSIPRDWLEEFEAAARRPLRQRMRYAFIRTYKPVLDDAPYRAFNTMEEYRRWCEENLPDWLGYGRV
jgi:hypothetical protein